MEGTVPPIAQGTLLIAKDQLGPPVCQRIDGIPSDTVIRHEPNHQFRNTIVVQVLYHITQRGRRSFVPFQHILSSCKNTPFSGSIGGGTVWISHNLAVPLDQIVIGIRLGVGMEVRSQSTKAAQGQSSGVPISRLSRKVQPWKVMQMASMSDPPV